MKFAVVFAVVVMGALAQAQTATVPTVPTCAVYKVGEKPLPNVPPCKVGLKAPDYQPPPDYIGSTSIFVAPQYAAWNEKIDKDGHYVMTFDDPKNEWRCAIVGLVGESNLKDGVTSFTIACYKLKDIPDERAKQ